MASFTINFQANTVGDHYIGYRTYNDPPNTYTVITENVSTPGAQAVEIQVPGNVYCGDIVYDGYVIASCQDQTDTGGNGIPDLAITWTVTLLQQTDPCVYAEITCDNTPIDSVTVTNGGTGGYVVGDSITVTEANPGDELVAAVLEVGSETGGIIDTINVINPGSYKSAPTLTAATGNGDAVLEAVMEACPLINLASIDCLGDDGLAVDPSYTLSLGDSITYCIDILTAGGTLGSQFIINDTDFCHCHTCKSYLVQNNDSVPRKITFQTCWDVSQTNFIQTTSVLLAAGQSYNVTCAMEDTLVTENNLFTINTYPCAYE